MLPFAKGLQIGKNGIHFYIHTQYSNLINRMKGSLELTSIQNDMFEFGEINENIEVEVIFFGHLFCGAVSFSCLLVNRETNCSPLCKYSLFPTEHIPWK